MKNEVNEQYRKLCTHKLPECEGYPEHLFGDNLEQSCEAMKRSNLLKEKTSQKSAKSGIKRRKLNDPAEKSDKPKVQIESSNDNKGGKYKGKQASKSKNWNAQYKGKNSKK